MGHADSDPHSKGIFIFQMQTFIGAYCVVRVEPHRAPTENIRQVVLGTLYMLDGVIVDLEICLDIQESGILNVRYVLKLEILQAATI